MGARTRALCMILCWAVGGAYAQTHQHYDVVALRVEFQPDTTRFTTGDGTFDGLRWGTGLDPKVDPLPHDDRYFRAHLEFLENYLWAVSGALTEITTHLVPGIVRVSQKMGTYSPVGMEADTDEERRKLARLVEEAWALADPGGINVSVMDAEHTFFVLFHAGIGRDVELLGTILEKTPLDLPSLYFSEASLTQLGVEGLSFGELPVANSAIVPRTESRLGYNSITQDSLLLELSINGLLASSFLSFLGVPDLFDTQTGESAIGSFGLMDPQGIFAYAGLFPPAPTAWTRQLLGWVVPQELEGAGPSEITLPAGGIARASVSEAEYFLVENRQRDPEGDGLVLRIWQDGATVEQRVEGITDDFNRYNVDGFAGGVVVGVDHYDFALPGRDADGTQYDGGVLIWHVDERVTGTGQVNADPLHRGVDLEEADAAQDLGYGNNPGSPFDFFYEGNPVRAVLPSGREIRFYENRLGPDTTPSSAANDGGASFIILENFSAPGPEMTFTYRMSAAHGISLESDLDLGTAVGPGSSIGGGDGFTFVFAGGSAGQVHIVAEGAATTLASLVRPAVSGNTLMTLVRDASGPLAVNAYTLPDLALSGSYVFPAALSEHHARAPLVAAEDGSVHVLLASGGESAVVTVQAGGTIETHLLPADATSLAMMPDGTVIITGQTYVRTVAGEVLWTFDEGGLGAFAPGPDGLWGAMTLVLAQSVQILGKDRRVLTTNISAYAGDAVLSDHVTLADLDADGRHEILTTAGEYLLAFTQGGAMAAGFPVRLPSTLVGQPLVAKRNGDHAVVVVAGKDGAVYAVEDGAEVPGFPLGAGASILTTPRLAAGRLEVVTGSGVLRTYRISDAGTVQWGEQHRTSANVNYAAELQGAGQPPEDRLLIVSETYNWPNPIRNGHTFLRLMTSQDATIEITIADMAGTVVHEAVLAVHGGSPAEYQWQAAVESGLYFARIQARDAKGRTDAQLIRMAVIR